MGGLCVDYCVEVRLNLLRGLCLRDQNGRLLRLNLSSSILCLLGVMLSLLFLALIFLLCLIIVIFDLDVNLSMYIPGVLGIFFLKYCYLSTKKKKKILCRNQMDTGRTERLQGNGFNYLVLPISQSQLRMQWTHSVDKN